MTFSMNELFLIYKGLGDAFFPSIFFFLLWKMMTVFIARHITVRIHEADGQAFFPTESLSSKQLSLSRPWNSGSCQGVYRDVTVMLANGRWLPWLHCWHRIKADERLWRAGSLSRLILTNTFYEEVWLSFLQMKKQKLREVQPLSRGHSAM